MIDQLAPQKNSMEQDRRLYGRYAVSEEMYQEYSPQTLERPRIPETVLANVKQRVNSKLLNEYYQYDKSLYHSKQNLSHSRQTSQEEVEAWKSFFYDLKERAEINKDAFHNAQKVWCFLEQKYNVEIPICVAEEDIVFEWSFPDLRLLIEFDEDSIWWYFKRKNNSSESIDEEVYSVDELLKSSLFLNHVSFIENKNYSQI